MIKYIIILLIIYLVCESIESFSNNNDLQYKTQWISEHEDVVCLIGVWGRLDLVKINIDLLKRQTKKCKILLIVSCPKDKKFAIDNGVEWVYTENQPLGRKWQVGLDACKKYNPNAILINGSDDLLSLNWVEKCYHYIVNQHYDIVGKSNWYILDLVDKKPYRFKYRNSRILLGAGRMISRSILDELNWSLFPLHKSKGLDTYCNTILNQHNATRLVLNTNDIFVVSLKGKYDTLNSMSKILEVNKKIQSIVINNKHVELLRKIIYFINTKQSKRIIEYFKLFEKAY